MKKHHLLYHLLSRIPYIVVLVYKRLLKPALRLARFSAYDSGGDFR